MSAKYNFGGISKRIGQYKVRVGQGDMQTRIKMMIKEEHTEIDLIEFDGKLTKAQVCDELTSQTGSCKSCHKIHDC